LTLSPSLGVIPCEYPDKLYLSNPKARMIFLPDPENRTIVSSFVWTNDKTPESDGWSDRIALAIQRSALRAMRTRCSHRNVNVLDTVKQVCSMQQAMINLSRKGYAVNEV